jgi:hypothetical protein
MKNLLGLALFVSLFGINCAPPDPNDGNSGFENPDYETIDGIWRVHADEIYDSCNSSENTCAEGGDDGCIDSNEWFWVTVQDYTNGIYTADFAMSDLAWYDVAVENGAFDNVLNLSMYG